MIKIKNQLNLTDEEFIDLIEAVDIALSTIIHRGSGIIDKPAQTKEGTTFAQRIFKEMIKEYDRYNTIRAKLILWNKGGKHDSKNN